MTTHPTPAQKLQVGDRLVWRNTDQIVTVTATRVEDGTAYLRMETDEHQSFPVTCKAVASFRRVIADAEPAAVAVPGATLKHVYRVGDTYSKDE